MNKKETTTIVLAIIFSIAIFGVWSMFGGTKNNQEATYCTMEAKQCPDGSYVGRSGPNCEFAKCPTFSQPTSTEGILPYNSGIKGEVMLGPTCPVIQNPPDPNCADKPYETLVTVFRKADPVHAFAITKSDKSGMFSFSLPPGEYVLGAGESNLPRCNHTDVTVYSEGYTQADISCDTGIR